MRTRTGLRPLPAVVVVLVGVAVIARAVWALAGGGTLIDGFFVLVGAVLVVGGVARGLADRRAAEAGAQPDADAQAEPGA